MEFETIRKLIVKKLIPKMEQSLALDRFVYARSKFEGWLKVELIDILIDDKIKPLTEVKWIDVSFDNTAIELKTCNTNYKYGDVLRKGRPITKNVRSVISDVERLNAKTEFKYKYVVFVVFPVEHDNWKWQKHLIKIIPKLKQSFYCEFMFNVSIRPTTSFHS
jgi:hypothetical protein